AWRLPVQKESIVPDMETKIAAHMAGVGIGFVPQPLCQTLIDKKELVSCTIPTMSPPSTLSLAWHKNDVCKAVEDIVKLF
ncbi:LysR substrate-binding domain-containing protein, partial [Salmonella enterica subsp. enterica serovar Infantis]